MTDISDPEIDDLKDEIEALKDQLEEARLIWGNCIRGCEPSYLDWRGFCSPACHLGQPRGKYPGAVLVNTRT